jgi:hypothetical protein
MEIEDEGLRAEALATIIAFIPDNPSLLRDLRLVIVDHLFKNMGMWKRDDVLYFLAKKRLFSPPVMEAATLGAIARHVIEICEEWTWL